MKLICLILLAAGCSLLAPAQTNAPGSPPTPRGPTLISSEHGDFDLAGHEAVYQGHVRVDDPQMKLVCERLIADVPQSGGHVSHIVALTNVVIDFFNTKGQTNHATGDQAVYVYLVTGGVTNETVTLTGNPQMDTPEGNTLTGDVIVWDRQNNHLSAHNMVARGNFNSLGGGTNSFATRTNSGAAAKTTNAQPEAVENPGPAAVPPQQP